MKSPSVIWLASALSVLALLLVFSGHLQGIPAVSVLLGVMVVGFILMRSASYTKFL